MLACSRRSDSGARAKTKAGERAGKNEGRLSERLEQAINMQDNKHPVRINLLYK